MEELVMTVTGPVPATQLGLTDAHNHLWIAPVPGTAPGAPVLNDEGRIAAELRDYRMAGGGSIVDCQPAFCGRDGRVLRRLAQESRVQVIAATGFHRRLYYSPEAPLWGWTAEEARDFFLGEMHNSLYETRGAEQPVRAGFIKIAVEATLEETPAKLLRGAAAALRESGAMLEMHTEQGASVERYLNYFVQAGVDPRRLVFCHVDKRPDLALHEELAQAGVMLEYDTFYRPKYRPAENVWPLLEGMVAAGVAGQIALATDMADANMWQHMGSGPGLVGIITEIKPRLEQMGFDAETVRGLLGDNISRRLPAPAL